MVTERVGPNEREVSLTIPSLFPRIRKLINDKVINDKRIAELQQTAGPLKLGVSKIEMAVSRSNFFGSPIWLIYTFYTAKGNINTKYRSPMCSILDTKRKSNIKISIPHNSKKGVFFGKKFF